MTAKWIYLGLLSAILATAAAVVAADRNGTASIIDGPGTAEVLTPEQAILPQDEFYGSGSLPCLDCQGADAGPWFTGADYRLIRTHFSEALAFVQVNDSLTPQGFVRQVQAQELNFNYNSSLRVFAGCHVGECQDLRFSYWNLNTDTAVNGTAIAGQTLVDPFGNVALTGSSIAARASVNLNVFDLEYLQSLNFPSQNVNFVYSAGLRFANVGQAYSSVIRDPGGTLLTAGTFNANFSGVGPYLSLTGSTTRLNRFSLFAKGGAAILIGSYNVAAEVTIPGMAVGSQSADRVRAVPILDAELGASWHPNERVTISAGWLFQAWSNIGVSGGSFSGQNLPVAPQASVFSETDDADIMSFDGLFVRAEVWF